MSNAFLIDVDDVCMDWMGGFFQFMRNHGMPPKERLSYEWGMGDVFPNISTDQINEAIRAFPHSLAYLAMEPIAGAVEAIQRLRSFFPDSLFVAVTACGTQPGIAAARDHQLREFPFDSKILVPHGASKSRVYRAFNRPVVIDDHVFNIESAIEADAGTAVLFSRPMNQMFQSDSRQFRRANGWTQIVSLFTTGSVE